MIVCELYRPSTGDIEQVEPSHVGALLQQEDVVLWVDLSSPEDADFTWLQETFHFHPLAIEDARQQQQRAKVDRYERFYFFVLHAIDHLTSSHRVRSSEIDLFIGPNYLVSVHRQKTRAMDEVRRRWERSHFPHEATPFLFYLIVDVVVDGYFPEVDEIGDLIDDIDQALFSQSDPGMLQTIFTLRRSLLTIRKFLGPLRDALNELIRSEEVDQLFRFERTRAYFTDVYDHVLRLTDFVDTYRDMLAGSLEAYQSSLSNRLNENMQRLTVAATVLATATVITGFYGMNLYGAGIQSRSIYGGYIVLGALVVITLVEIWLFYRKKWL